MIVISLCLLTQFLIDQGLRSYDDDMYGDWNRIFRGQINSDILILGSSRAKVQVDPKIMESITGLSCHNFGIMAARVILEKTVWKAIINYNRIPKLLIKNVDFFSLKKEDNIVNKETFLPYLSKPEMESLREIDDNIWLEEILPLYKYRGYRETVFTGLRSYFGFSDLPDIKTYKGYSPVLNKWNDEFEEITGTNWKRDPLVEDLRYGFEYLKELIIDCKKNNIELILIHMPMYIDLNQPPIGMHRDSLYTAINIFVTDNNLHYWDYSKDSLSYSKKYFYNSLHLNKTGAEIFTKHLANDLRKFIQNSSTCRDRDI